MIHPSNSQSETVNELISFYCLAFFISWLGWVPQTLNRLGLLGFEHPLLSLLGGAGPTLAAIIVLWWRQGRNSLPSLFRPLFHWHQSWSWYFIVFVFWFVVAGLALLVMPIFGRTLEFVGPFLWGSLLPIFLAMLLSNVWEEIGWRGFALPRFQQRFSDLSTAIIMGLLWSLWHLPLAYDPTSPMSAYPWPAEILFSLSQSVIYIWLFNSTDGSLLFVSIFHAMSNTVAFALLELDVLLVSYPSVVAITGLFALAILIRYGPGRFGAGANSARLKR